MELRIWRGSQILPTVHRAGVLPSSRDLLACDCLSIVGLPPTPVQRYLASFPPGPLFSVPEVVPFPNMDPSAQPPPFAMAPTSPTEAEAPLTPSRPPASSSSPPPPSSSPPPPPSTSPHALSPSSPTALRSTSSDNSQPRQLFVAPLAEGTNKHEQQLISTIYYQMETIKRLEEQISSLEQELKIRCSTDTNCYNWTFRN